MKQQQPWKQQQWSIKQLCVCMKRGLKAAWIIHRLQLALLLLFLENQIGWDLGKGAGNFSRKSQLVGHAIQQLLSNHQCYVSLMPFSSFSAKRKA